MRVLPALLVVLVLGASCKGKDSASGTGSAGSGSAAAKPPPVDWKVCDAALEKAAAAPIDARPQIVIDGCKVCGEWKPLLQWNKPHTEGGPTRPELEAALTACGAWCEPTAKLRFMGTLDNARGTDVRTPWRHLGDVCKDRVSAVPDTRYMTAPFFALDRIARAAGGKGGATAGLVAALELPLPAVTVTGVGVVVPELDAGVSPRLGALQITLLGDQVYVGKMPRAHLAAGGVVLDAGTTDYPGTKVALAELGGALAKLVGDDKTATVTLLAPHAMPAQGLVPIIAAAATAAPLYLGAIAAESPTGWDLVGTIPVALEAGGSGAIVVTPEMTVQNLATELARRGASHINRAGVTSH